MEMRITISGAGFSLGKSGFGLNALTGAYIETRLSSAAKPCVLGLVKGPSLGSDSGSLVFGHVQTKWFRISEELHPWVARRGELVGKTASVELTGTLAAGGRVDVAFDVIDKDGEITSLVSKANIEASGVQLSSTKVRGVLRYMPGGSCAAA